MRIAVVAFLLSGCVVGPAEPEAIAPPAIVPAQAPAPQSMVIAGPPLAVVPWAQDETPMARVTLPPIVRPAEEPTDPIVVAEGLDVIPQTVLHLSIDPELEAKLGVTSWHWSVKQPHLSASVLLPGAEAASPTFEANVVGEYEFAVVVDGPDIPATTLPSALVMVLPTNAIHVELLWHTPSDSDETDEGPEVGSDMDLHFIHDAYSASGPDLDEDGKPDGWFDQPFDCFWFNAHPNWGSFDPATDDDPRLDRDDTDGAGPENLNLDIPENTVYRIGVHYWSDHGYGPSEATVRVYIDGGLELEVTCTLVNHDMWNVATISWPDGAVTPTSATDVCSTITPKYQNPFFFQP